MSSSTQAPPQQVAIDAPFRWIRLGLADLRACPLPSLFYGLCFSAMGYALAFVLRGQPQYLAAVTAGFLLLAPALSIGLYDISRRREQGIPCALTPTLTAWRANLANIGVFSLVLIVIFLIWARASLVVFAIFFSGPLPDMKSLMTQVVTPDKLEFLVVWLAVGFVFALLVFAISVVSVPLMMDRDRDAVSAALTSVRAFTLNPAAMAMWGAIIAWTTAAGLLMGFLGVILVVPLLGHATWHAYRELLPRGA